MTDSTQDLALVDLLARIRSCRHCEASLPLGPRPVLRAGSGARLLIVGQAPGTRVHESGIPWNDPSGDRLRQWLQLTPEQFYDETRVAIVPMGFCYPGRGKSGDLPPPPACAPLWHEQLLQLMPQLDLVLLVGSYAQTHYLGRSRETLTERVRRWVWDCGGCALTGAGGSLARATCPCRTPRRATTCGCDAIRGSRPR